MTEWSHGYNVSAGYTYGYFRELAPDWLDYGLALAGQQAPQGMRRRYLELGCGQGFNLLLHAAAFPEIEFLGIDFNPLHIAHARDLVARAGLTNLRFEEADFLALAAQWPADYGQFDYVVLHGIYSWISRDLRRAVISCLKQAVRPAGVVYNSYNALPGWTSALPLQHLLRRHEQVSGQKPAAAIESGLALMQRLKEADASLFKALPHLGPRLDSALKQDRAYLVQEYLHDEWHPMWHGQVAGEMAGAKLSYVGTATLAEAYLPQLLSEGLRTLANECDDPLLRQELIDTAINQSFRRDLYQRGAIKDWPVQQAEWWKRVRLLATNKQPAEGKFAFSTSYGEVNGQPELYQPLIDALRAGPKTVAELHGLPPFTGKPLGVLIQAISFLLHAGFALLHRTQGDVKTSSRVNRAIARAVTEGAPYSYLVAAYGGQAIVASTVDMLLLDTHAENAASNLPQLAEGLWQRLVALGRTLQKDGVVLTEPESIRSEALAQAEQFVSSRLPEWKRLGVWG